MKHLPPGVADLLQRLNPSATVLLDVLRQRVCDSILREIANADYGCDATDHLEALRRIRDQGEIPCPLEWHPKEVLGLIRWSEPEDPAWKPGSTGSRGHIMRAFSCAVLLRGGAEPKSDFEGENETLIQLLSSALVLGSEITMAALRFVCWRVLSGTVDEEELPFFALSILLLCSSLRIHENDPDFLVKISLWVEEEEARASKSPKMGKKSETWLLGLTNFNRKHAVWKTLAKEILLEPNTSLPEKARVALNRIGKRLLGRV